MIVLLAMIGVGIISFKMGWIDKHGYQKLATLVVKVFNPALIFTAFSNKSTEKLGDLMIQNLIACILFYIFLILIAVLYVRVFKVKDKKNKTFQLMMIFSNVGYMGIPLIKAMLGNEFIIFVVFYSLFYNIFAYTYGIYLAMGLSDEHHDYSIKYMFNIGTISSLIVIVLFALNIQLPNAALTFFDYVGNTAIPLSMIMVGISLAQMDFSEIMDKDEIVFFVFKMVIVPAIGIFLFKNLNFDEDILLICFVMLSMPVGSLTGMLAEEYGQYGAPCNRMIAFTTAISVITVPLLSLLY